jgi:hypothetical protein
VKIREFFKRLRSRLSRIESRTVQPDGTIVTVYKCGVVMHEIPFPKHVLTRTAMDVLLHPPKFPELKRP